MAGLVLKFSLMKQFSKQFKLELKNFRMNERCKFKRQAVYSGNQNMVVVVENHNSQCFTTLVAS